MSVQRKAGGAMVGARGARKHGKRDLLVTALSAVAALSGALSLGAAPATAGMAARHEPVIARVAPRSGSTAGGTTVTITGSHFDQIKYVLFGHARGTHLRVISSRKLIVMKPPQRAEAEAVTVMTAHGGAQGPASQAFVFGTPKAAPPAKPTPAFAGTASVKLKSGYSFNVSYSVTIGTPTTESTDDPPGYTMVFVPYTVSATVTDTTPGRAIDFGDGIDDDQFGIDGSSGFGFLG